MAYMITHSLLSAWLRSMRDDPFEDASTERDTQAEFLKVLRREPTEQTEAMLNGIEFEDLVTAIAGGKTFGDSPPRWHEAAARVAETVKGGQFQLPASRRVTVRGTELLLYGRLDALKAGHVYDIKFSRGYERGQYFGSTQHPMYLELLPEAEDFTYLVSNGTEVWTETYRRDETPSILPVCGNFLDWLGMTGLRQTWMERWEARS